MQKNKIIVMLIALVACVPARAADICLTLPQARAAHPGKYLLYHLDGGRRCWDAQTRRTVRHRVPPPLQTSVPVPRPTVLWPALSLTATPVDAALLTPEPATAWPLLLDVDEITADDPLATSYWPPLDEPGSPFSDRWFALPSNWFAAVTQ